MTIADRIRQRRLDLNLSQSELAVRANYYDKTAISKIEHSGNDISMKQVKRLAKALSVSSAYLMGWEEPEPDERLLNAYINNAQDQEFLELYRKADPVIQQAVLNFLKNAPHDP